MEYFNIKIKNVNIVTINNSGKVKNTNKKVQIMFYNNRQTLIINNRKYKINNIKLIYYNNKDIELSEKYVYSIEYQGKIIYIKFTFIQYWSYKLIKLFYKTLSYFKKNFKNIFLQLFQLFIDNNNFKLI